MTLVIENTTSGLCDLPDYDLPLSETGAIRPFSGRVRTLVIGAALSASALGLGGPGSITSAVPEPIVVASASDRMKAWMTPGQRYVSNRLDAMLGHSKDPELREEYPSYPSTTVIDAARKWVDTLVTDTTPTPSVVPGDGGVVEFVWVKSGWDLMVTVGEAGAEMWARHDPTGRTEVDGDRPEDLWQFQQILGSLRIQ